MVTKEDILEELKKIIDPELNVNIVELGLIYDIKITPSKEIASFSDEELAMTNEKVRCDVQITMTLTTPGCPLSSVFEEWIPDAVKKIKGVKNVHINLVWEPPWDPDKMSDDAKESLGIIK